MRITHPSGSEYDLYPETEIEIVRFNPFFHSLGEQSYPVSIPASGKNLLIVGYPEKPDNANKLAARLDTTIQSGSFSVVGRQAILSAQGKGSIETSFYLNEGAFYEKMSDLTLAEIFAGKKVEFAGIDAAITFMTNLITTDDPRFAVFAAITDNYIINEIEYRSGGGYFFVKDKETEETIDGASITVPKGFYITPFVKVLHLLTEVFSHLGYTLAPSFLNSAPFKDMVFLNDNLDTIVANSINYVDIVPNITVKTMLEVIRKFNAEFVPDETKRIVNIIPFDHVLQEPPSIDLTPYSVSIPVVSYHNNYQQVKLSSERLSMPSVISYLRYSGTKTYRYDINISASPENNLFLMNILSQYPSVYLRRVDGAIVRDGIRGDVLFTERVSSLSMPYYAGGILPVDDHSFPDVVPDIYLEKIGSTYTTYPYAGKGRTLQSKIEFSNQDSGDETIPDSRTNPEELKPMLCLYYRSASRCIGTLYNYDNTGNRLWDYSLMWNGESGIFEKFWRQRDLLLRNALLSVQVNMNLPENLKLSIPSVRRVSFNSQNYLISELHYSTKSNSEGLCSLLSTKLQKPISEAKPASEFFRERLYKWNIKRSYSYVGEPGHPAVYRFASEPVAFYPPDPTPAQYSSGGRYFQRTYTVEYGRRGRDNEFIKLGDCEMTVWLEPALF